MAAVLLIDIIMNAVYWGVKSKIKRYNLFLFLQFI